MSRQQRHPQSGVPRRQRAGLDKLAADHNFRRFEEYGEVCEDSTDLRCGIDNNLSAAGVIIHGKVDHIGEGKLPSIESKEINQGLCANHGVETPSTPAATDEPSGFYLDMSNLSSGSVRSPVYLTIDLDCGTRGVRGSQVHRIRYATQTPKATLSE